jgi:probable phosphoglycerate mutase
MGMGTELWLVRHGETEWSLSGAHTSRTDTPLTERGRQKARNLHLALDNILFDVVFVSPRLRALETCALAGFEDRAIVKPALREWDYGIYEGRTTAEIQTQVPEWSVWTSEIVGGEAVSDVGTRADGLISDSLGVAPTGKKVVLFGHAHILRIVAARWIGLDAQEAKHLALGTASVSVLGWERETRVVQSWNRQS